MMDRDALVENLKRAVAEAYLLDENGVHRFDSSTPMNEIRAQAEEMGVMMGRVLGIAQHEGPINADIAIILRGWENNMIEQCLNTIGTHYGPGGVIREEMTGREHEE